jgi:lysophospholipase L1-like esterase
MKPSSIKILCVFASVVSLPLLCAAQDEAAILRRSLVDMGNTARLQHALAKARRGEPVVVGVIGGSITAGARASKPELSWGNLAAKWWTDSLPQAKITFVNAGIGATCSDLGAHRVQAHLLDKHPDIVMVEYAVNDGINPMAAETLEGLVRRILKEPNEPAVMLLFTMDNKGGNKQQEHMEIGKHYGLPMASFRDALWPEVEAKRIAWTDIEADEVHPNDRGHAYCAQFMTDICARVLKDLPADKNLPVLPVLPEPMTANLFEKAGFYNADTITPAKNEGWEVFTDPAFGGFFGKGWKTAAPGSTLEFDLEGRAVSLLFYRIKGAMGIAQAQIDDQPPVKMDAWFSADWGGYVPFQLVARDLAPGKHTLRVTLLGDKNPESTGNEFHINAVLIAK